jgi:NADP-dependent 3-hydroxy acid dehydrogenase YdfG
MGTMEETTTVKTFEQFNTNVFGLMNTTRAVLPYMREQWSGVGFQYRKHCWMGGIAGGGLYAAMTFTVAAIAGP